MLAAFAVAFAGAYWLLTDGGTKNEAGSTAAVVHDDVIPVGAELGRPIAGDVPGPGAEQAHFGAPGSQAQPTVYLAGSAEQRDMLLQGEREANAIRSLEGYAPFHDEYVVVDGDGAGFVEGMDEANRIRAADGLAPFEIVDLR